MSERQAWVWWKQPSTGTGGKTCRTSEMKQTSSARSRGSWNKRNKCKSSFSKSIFRLHALSIIFPFCSYYLVKFSGGFRLS